MMRSHAIANGVFIAALQPGRPRRRAAILGGSFVSDPNGNLIAKASHEQEEI